MATALVPDEPIILAAYRRRGEALDSYQVWCDGPVLHIHGRGHWDLRTAKSYTTEIARIIAALRLEHPHVRAIVDRRVAPTFDPGVSDILMATYRDILRQGDRIAMVVGSSLMKGHIRQIAGREETQSFLSVSAAQTWVLAYG